MRPKHSLVYSLALAAPMLGILHAQASSAPAPGATLKTSNARQEPQKAKDSHPASHVSAKAQPSEGDVIFHQHCAGCHNAPEGFSPRISGTVIRHMRVRVGLSEHDEQELLRFLNP